MEWKLSMEKGTHSNSHRVQKKEEEQSRPRGLCSKQFPLAQPFCLTEPLNSGVGEGWHWAGVEAGWDQKLGWVSGRSWVARLPPFAKEAVIVGTQSSRPSKHTHSACFFPAGLNS